MKITYDEEVDALYVQFRKGSARTRHLGKQVAADYDAEGHLAGIEVLDAGRLLGGPAVVREVIQGASTARRTRRR